MSTELAQRPTYTSEQVRLIKDTICRGSTDDELKLFVSQCERTGLDPFARQIHAVKRWDSTLRREVLSIQTGIDGFRLIAERTGAYAGNDDPVYDVENADHPGKATVTVWKFVNGQRIPFSRSARWNEFVQTKKDGEVTRFWAKMPYLMLGKVAEALALRAAFPQELSGLYTTDEMGQADNDPDHGHAPAGRVAPPVTTPKAIAATAETNGNTDAEHWALQLRTKLLDKEKALIAAGKCYPGELMETMVQGFADADLPDQWSKWIKTQQKVGIGLSMKIIEEFEAREKPGENLDADPVEDDAVAV